MKPSLLANAFESLIAAMFQDGGFDRTAAFIRELFEPLIEEKYPSAIYRDYKTAIQEKCQILFREMPRYMVISETGPDHDKRFETSLMIGERVIATGTGRSKKEAEQQAARIAMEKLRKIDPAAATATAAQKNGKAPVSASPSAAGPTGAPPAATGEPRGTATACGAKMAAEPNPPSPSEQQP
jgi:hypothetical protein